MSDPQLSLNSITKRFAHKVAVEDVSFTVEPGEIIGYLGPNGAGKTTTLRIALGLVKPDEGYVEIFGQPPGVSAFGRIGFLPEERGLYKKQTPRESIAHMARLNGMRATQAFTRADELLEKYGLGEAKRKKNKDLSKGMAQKVQLLAAIAHDPEFYILDEPFSGLDPVNQQILENMVREIANLNRTIIFTTHVMEHAERLCDRIILISQGRKIFDGSTREALDRAPRRLVVGSDDAGLTDTLTPFAMEIGTRKDGTLNITLKNGADAHDILESLVERKIKLKHFDPKPPTLHEAFVSMVGAGKSAKTEESLP
ncbi:MAG: ATP-binding cassette domain-containing protein [Hyphomonadaceae bacterium]|nr:ATP-binding cassette domain-containing protein [Hyphomonadaceae bacterium]MBC6412517.1 ATP-binding cassette domain-containing protein [Hyphomonadaceae bacterium]